MAPRKGGGVFASNKVNPAGSSSKFRKRDGRPEVRRRDESDFFIRPADSGSTTEGVRVERNGAPQPGNEKRPFDKKKWRLQRYSKKYRVQQWEDKRKKAVLREYYKQIDDRPKFDVKKIYEEEEEGDELEAERDEAEPCATPEEEKDVVSSDGEVFKGNKARRRAHEEFQRIKAERKRAKEEALTRKAEKREAREKGKEERTSRLKRLNRKTKRGQPIMKERMELLLEQIQKNLNK